METNHVFELACMGRRVHREPNGTKPVLWIEYRDQEGKVRAWDAKKCRHMRGVGSVYRVPGTIKEEGGASAVLSDAKFWKSLPDTEEVRTWRALDELAQAEMDSTRHKSTQIDELVLPLLVLRRKVGAPQRAAFDIAVLRALRAGG